MKHPKLYLCLYLWRMRYWILKLSSILFFIIVLKTQSNAQFINVSHYENKAQAYAILSAQFSKEAYFHAKTVKNLIHIKNNCDTGFVFTQLALEYADSALIVADKSSVEAILVMKRAINYQQNAKLLFQEIKNTQKTKTSNTLVFALGNAVDDAYLASLLFDFVEDSVNVEEKMETKPRDVSRLETDEFSFMTIKELFGTRLVEIEDELTNLEKEAINKEGEDLIALNMVIEQLKKEQVSFSNDMKNSGDKLVSIRNELSEEMLKVVDATIFTTQKQGFYNENVPIPLNTELPEGLVYKIQVGFFQNQLPEAHFDGIFPLASEQVDNVYFRYTAGSFSVYQEAKNALLEINKKGYKDAFVVAYFNGKKITISEALKFEIKN